MPLRLLLNLVFFNLQKKNVDIEASPRCTIQQRMTRTSFIRFYRTAIDCISLRMLIGEVKQVDECLPPKRPFSFN